MQMSDTEKRIGYEVAIQEVEREAHDRTRLRAVVYEVIEIAGERRQIEMAVHPDHRFRWQVEGGDVEKIDPHGQTVRLNRDPNSTRGMTARVVLSMHHGDTALATSTPFSFAGPAVSDRGGPGGGSSAARGGGGSSSGGAPIAVQLSRTPHGSTRDLILWTAIRYSAQSIRFTNYARFLDYVLCGEDDALPKADELLETDERGVFSVGNVLAGERSARKHAREEDRLLRFGKSRLLTGVDAYRALRDATEWFLKVHCGVLPAEGDFARIEADLAARVGATLLASGPSPVEQAWDAYTVRVNGVRLLPYMKIIRDRLADVPIGKGEQSRAVIECTGLLQDKLQYPCFVELLWSYWQEEGMLVQTMNAIANRFQNRRARGDRDPLANLEIDTLRPLNNVFWGFVQEELNRLSVVRRAYEYEAHYGLRLEGRAVPRLRPADRRSKFLEAFHNFLHRCLRFFQQDDDTTVIADGFPVLNAIKEVHYLLAQGANNQFGDLPSTARAEMLVQQWLLARPELRDFLGGRISVPYPEPWMDRVDSMKTLKGWSDTSVVHFNDLATFGEQIVLGLRYGAWSLVNEPASAANFARAWRAEIQGYVHAYRAVTGVDLGADATTPQLAAERDLPPSAHLKKRLALRRNA
jgi:hypothetical protein